MSVFRRISTQAVVANHSPQEPQADIPVAAIQEANQEPPRKNTLPSDQTVFDIVSEALAKHGATPRPGRGGWIRIPAVWRGSKDRNVSVHSTSGFAIDYPDNSRRIEFEELMELLEHDPGNVKLKRPDNIAIQNSTLERVRDAQSLFKKGTDLVSLAAASRVARSYLKNRGVPEESINHVSRQVRAVPGKFGGVTFVIPIYQPSRQGQVIGVQRIFLDSHGQKYGEEPKMMLGCHYDGDKAGGFLIGGDRSRFNRPEVAVCEGFETGLAVYSATGMPVYVLFDSGGMRAVHLEYLSMLGVTAVLIAADNDDPDKFGHRAGQEAAEFVATRLVKEYIPARVALPSRKYTDGRKCDWLDIWNADPAGTGRMLLSAPNFVPKAEPQPTVKSSMKGIFKRP